VTGKVVIAGYGPVGQAHEVLLKSNQFTTQIVDPDYYKILGGTQQFKGRVFDYKPQSVIVCVSTPAKTDGSCNINNIISVLEDIMFPVPILIKSTISIEGWKQINKKFPKYQITYSPEYLTQKNAINDFLSCDTVSLGGGDIEYWKTFWNSNKKKTLIRNPEELILGKNFRNAFLATKVSFFNQIYDYCKTHDIDFEQVRQEVTNDNRIGESHSYVNNDRGYGGHCLPKDVKSILNSAKHSGVDLNIIAESKKYNDKIRKNT